MEGNALNIELDSDEVLVERAKADSASFGVLYQRHLPPIYSYIYHHTGNAHDAEDLTAKTFLQALSNIHRYENRGVPFSAWLFRIAHNLMANWHRDRHRHRNSPLEEAFTITESGSDPGEKVEAGEEVTELMAAVSRLPLDRQYLLALKFSQGRPNAKIADAMGRSEGAVKALLHRTLVDLKRKMAVPAVGHSRPGEVPGGSAGSSARSDPLGTLRRLGAGTDLLDSLRRIGTGPEALEKLRKLGAEALDSVRKAKAKKDGDEQ